MTSLCEGACPRHILARRRRRLGDSEADDTGCCAQPGVPAPSICVASSGLVVARLTPPLLHQQPDGGVGGWGTRGVHTRVQMRIQRPFLRKHPTRLPAGCCDASRFNFALLFFHSGREGQIARSPEIKDQYLTSRSWRRATTSQNLASASPWL